MAEKSPSDIELLQTITTRNGYVFTPSVVTDQPTKAVRGVQVVSNGGQTLVTINATDRCLKSIKQSVRGKLGANVQFTDEITSEPTQGDSDATA